MELAVGTWNVEDAFSDHLRGVQAARIVRGMRPDAMVLPEAYNDVKELDGPPEEFSITELFQSIRQAHFGNDYELVHASYDDIDGRADRHGIAGVFRHERLADAPQVMRLAGRVAVKAELRLEGVPEPVQYYGVHADDRREETRLQLAREIDNDRDPRRELIVAGDMNAMHPGDSIARMLRVLPRRLVDRLPAADPDPFNKPSKVQRFGSILQRFARMASGDSTTAYVTDMGLTDADPDHRPTIKSHRPIAQLDRVMVSPGLEVVHHQLLPAVRMPGGRQLSDHLGVVASLRARQD